MAHRPSFADFEKLAQGHTLVPVYRQLVADALTPVSAFARLRSGGWSFLFESVVGGERVGRYSFLGANPFRWFESYGHTVTERVGTETSTREHPDPLKLLEERLQEFRAPYLPSLPRFSGGAVGYAGYDTVRYVEKLPNAPPDDRHLPDLSFAFYDEMAIFDHINKTVSVVVHADTRGDLRQAYYIALGRVDEIVKKLSTTNHDLTPLDIDLNAPRPSASASRYSSNFGSGGYQAAVKKSQEYIFAGDIFQVVLSQRFRTQTTAKGFDIYRALRVINPSPFMFFVEGGPVTLVGASPEIMCRVENGEMVVRPLAGTRRRGATPEEDRQLAQELLADPKERAEHIMLVDLARNDVGRVAELGSVQISDLLTVERYSHVMHLSSTVTGRLAKEYSAFDAMRSALPAGTLSGAPKVRAMEIIDELEPHRRGPYGGAIGYIDFTGNTDTCIALRTMVLRDQIADVQAGAGIVADSDPDAEYQETVNKAMSLLRALEVAESQLTK
jgi:anthranilate synthase component I